jgi:hypothetical protein
MVEAEALLELLDVGDQPQRIGRVAVILRDGRACIDNSAVERAMRPIALGRRKWSFLGFDAVSAPLPSTF